MSNELPIEFRCPVNRDRLVRAGDELAGERHGLRYPIVDGVPVLIAEADERARVIESSRRDATTDPSRGAASDFYNTAAMMDRYLCTDLSIDREYLERHLKQITIDGPMLEIGSGRGALQGVGGDYVALDYSLVSLQKFVRPEFARVCASAERLPFADATFRLVFSVACLEHVPDAAAAMLEIDRVLKPGGIAHVSPAWHCVQYICDGVPVRPYRELSWGNKFVKATLPLRRSTAFKGVTMLPRRVVRRALWSLDRRPSEFRFSRLNAEYGRFWMSDSDACSRLDSHEACLFFASRGYRLIRPSGSAKSQLFAGSGAVIVQKP